MQTVAGQRVGENLSDLEQWMRDLRGCPTVTHTMPAHCPSEFHSDEPGTWFYIEADSGAGIVRRRCLSCGFVVATLDSDERWNHPRMWACGTCGQSITEVVAGVHAPAEHPDESLEPGDVSWVAIGVRCVGCGALDGVTDFVLPPTPWAEVAGRL
jgi:hypothetical protein